MKEIPRWTDCRVTVDGKVLGALRVSGLAPEAARESGTLYFSAAFPDEREIYNCWISAEPFTLEIDGFAGEFRVMSVEFSEFEAKPMLVVHVVRPEYFDRGRMAA